LKFERDGTPDLITVSEFSEHSLRKENGYFLDIYDINYDYNVKTSAHFYVTITNVVSSLGGILSITDRIINYLTVAITFHYFWSFGNTLKRLSLHDIDIN
jgi:hypothetical protein